MRGKNTISPFSSFFKHFARGLEEDGKIEKALLDETPILDGFLLDKDVKGEIITLTLAPNESRIIPHGLRSIPKYRLILRQTGNAVISDVDAMWTDKTIGLLNNAAVATTITIKIFP